ncbi:MAG: hypothetical protein HC819_14855 [Cyclobacteriaceae bacterium]|nr:hypothetical protein [Cyclobacteriaceae bacterium]
MSTKKKAIQKSIAQPKGKYRTADGQYFKAWSWAYYHAQTLENKEIITLE